MKKIEINFTATQIANRELVTLDALGMKIVLDKINEIIEVINNLSTPNKDK